jgi:hypothetical protein
MNQVELYELMTVQGFYRYLGQQAHLPTEQVKKIYLLGRPWGVWPPDIDISREAAEAGVDVFTYLAALHPLMAMDTQEKESQLATYEMKLVGDESQESPSVTGQRVEKVAALATEKKQTICDVLHALYNYRKRVGALSIEKILEKAAAIAKIHGGIRAASDRRRNETDHGPTPHSEMS